MAKHCFKLPTASADTATKLQLQPATVVITITQPYWRPPIAGDKKRTAKLKIYEEHKNCKTYVMLPLASWINTFTADRRRLATSDAAIATSTGTTPSSVINFRALKSSLARISMSFAATSFSSQLPKWSFFTDLWSKITDSSSSPILSLCFCITCTISSWSTLLFCSPLDFDMPNSSDGI